MFFNFFCMFKGKSWAGSFNYEAQIIKGKAFFGRRGAMLLQKERRDPTEHWNCRKNGQTWNSQDKKHNKWEKDVKGLGWNELIFGKGAI